MHIKSVCFKNKHLHFFCRSEVIVLEVLRLSIYLIADLVLASWNINTGKFDTDLPYTFLTLYIYHRLSPLCFDDV